MIGARYDTDIIIMDIVIRITGSVDRTAYDGIDTVYTIIDK